MNRDDLRNKMEQKPRGSVPMDIFGLQRDRTRWATTTKPQEDNMGKDTIVLRLIDEAPKCNAFAVSPHNPLWIMKRDIERQRELEKNKHASIGSNACRRPPTR